jgi:hypothetical protein
LKCNSAGLTINGVGGTLHLGTGLTHTFTGSSFNSRYLKWGSSSLKLNFTGSAWTGSGTNFIAGTGTVNFGSVTNVGPAATVFNNFFF